MKTGVKYRKNPETYPVYPGEDSPHIAFIETRNKSIYSYWPTLSEAMAAQSEMLHSVRADNVEEQPDAA